MGASSANSVGIVSTRGGLNKARWTGGDTSLTTVLNRSDGVVSYVKETSFTGGASVCSNTGIAVSEATSCANAVRNWGTRRCLKLAIGALGTRDANTIELGCGSQRIPSRVEQTTELSSGVRNRDTTFTTESVKRVRTTGGVFFLVLFRSAHGTWSAIVGREEVITENTFVTIITGASGASDGRTDRVSSATGTSSVGERSTRGCFVVTLKTGISTSGTLGIRCRCTSIGLVLSTQRTNSASLADTVLGFDTTRLAGRLFPILAEHTIGTVGAFILLSKYTILAANLGIVLAIRGCTGSTGCIRAGGTSNIPKSSW